MIRSNWKPLALVLGGAVSGAALVMAFFLAKPEDSLRLSSAQADSARKLDPWERGMDHHFQQLFEEQRNVFKNFDSFFNDDFFRRSDPFEDMRKFRERVGKETAFASPFDSWFGSRFGGGEVHDISMQEDNKYITYEIKLQGVEGETLKTDIEGGVLTITGETKRSEESSKGGGSSRSFFSSSFRRSIPLPQNVDADKVEMRSEKDKVVLKFPKK